MHTFLVHSSVVLRAIILMGLFFLGHGAYAAEVTLTESPSSVVRDEIFSVTVGIDPQGATVRTIDATLGFDPAVVAVIGLSKDNSVFSLWTTEPTFSNTAGTIAFGGASLAPVNAPAGLVVVTFKAHESGAVALRVATSSIALAEEADGAPHNALATPVVQSAVFYNPDIWYATKTGEFTWELPPSVTKIALDISTTPDTEPMTVYDPPIAGIALTPDMLVEGVQYLALQYKDDTEWGAVLQYPIMIDTMPPEAFVVEVSEGGAPAQFPVLRFEATDAVSGMYAYEVTVAGVRSAMLLPEDVASGYVLTDLEDGTYTVTVTAIDTAGNRQTTQVDVRVTAGWLPPVAAPTQPSWNFSEGTHLTITILLFIVAVQGAHALYARRRFALREERLRAETYDIQSKLEKIFSALRDEIATQVHSLAQKKRLTKKEREVAQSLNQALEISEALLGKEIADVTKILKKK